MTIFIWKLFALYVIGSIALCLCIGPVIRWGLGEDEPPEFPPLPSGSLHDDDRLTS